MLPLKRVIVTPAIYPRLGPSKIYFIRFKINMNYNVTIIKTKLKIHIFPSGEKSHKLPKRYDIAAFKIIIIVKMFQIINKHIFS